MNYESKELVDKLAGEVFGSGGIFEDFKDTAEYEGSIRAEFDTIKNTKDIEDEKLYRIGEASKLLGVKASILRDWDKKFSKFLKTKRTSGRQRLYSGSDIKVFSKIKQKIDEGYSLNHIHKIILNGEDKVSRDLLDTVNRKIERIKYKINDITKDIEEASRFV